MRLLPGYIFFLLLALPAAAQNASWWYPLGPPEATRRISAPTDSQDTADLVVKWSTSRLKNSPVLLVGTIYQESDPAAQQVVGMESRSNRLTILSSGGRRLVDKPADPLQLGENILLSLTGLFNTQAATPNPTGNPDVIGIGVVKTQETASQRLFGLLADSAGGLVSYLRIDPLASDLNENNRTAGIFPVAAFKPPGESPVAIAMVTQDSFDGTAATPAVNSLRRYRLGAIDASQEWSTPFAPRAYGQHPAILGRQSGIFVAPSNQTYDYTPPDTVRPPTPGFQVETFSDYIYSFNFRVDVSVWKSGRRWSSRTGRPGS